MCQLLTGRVCLQVRVVNAPNSAWNIFCNNCSFLGASSLERLQVRDSVRLPRSRHVLPRQASMAAWAPCTSVGQTLPLHACLLCQSAHGQCPPFHWLVRGCQDIRACIELVLHGLCSKLLSACIMFAGNGPISAAQAAECNPTVQSACSAAHTTHPGGHKPHTGCTC